MRAWPLSSTRAGHPSAAQRAAMAATVCGSEILLAVPSTTRSKSWVATLRTQRGSRARFLPLRVRSPVSNQNEPSAQRAPIPVTCGLPSALIVVNQHVWRLGPPESGAWVMPLSSPASISETSRAMASRTDQQGLLRPYRIRPQQSQRLTGMHRTEMDGSRRFRAAISESSRYTGAMPAKGER